MSCLTAVTRGYLLSVDARCDCDDGDGRFVIRSGDTVGLRMEMAGSDALPSTPMGAAWRAFDWATREPITEVVEIDPSDDMSFAVSGLVHDGRPSDLRRIAVEIVLRFNDGEDPDLLTAVAEVWVRRQALTQT